MNANLKTIQGIYEAFGRGDVPAILERVSPNVEWEYGWNSHEAPWLVPGRGREHVANFLRVLATDLDMQVFQVNRILADGDTVVALCDVTAIVRKNGQKVVERDEAHIWKFDERGMVVRFRHGADTHRHVQAWKA